MGCLNVSSRSLLLCQALFQPAVLGLKLLHGLLEMSELLLLLMHLLEQPCCICTGCVCGCVALECSLCSLLKVVPSRYAFALCLPHSLLKCSVLQSISACRTAQARVVHIFHEVRSSGHLHLYAALHKTQGTLHITAFHSAHQCKQK